MLNDLNEFLGSRDVHKIRSSVDCSLNLLQLPYNPAWREYKIK
jgi:hypothetical protein